MSTESTTAPVDAEATASTTTAPSTDELDALRRHNRELLDDLKKVKAKASSVPEGVNVQELLDFKRKTEQAEAERAGKYDDALKAYEAQFRDREEQYKKRIEDLEREVRTLKLDSRVVAKVADQVHDPDAVLRLEGDKLTLNDAGEPVFKDGYSEVPLDQWLADLQQRRPYLFKAAAKPQGSGAPVGSRSGASMPEGMKNPFSPEHFNLTEQGRLYKTNPDLYNRLKAEARR